MHKQVNIHQNSWIFVYLGKSKSYFNAEKFFFFHPNRFDLQFACGYRRNYPQCGIKKVKLNHIIINYHKKCVNRQNINI